mmetsp:Transcript_104851/g.197589  ORF Transcript_104851/g.197589 Transcript_104851/m.197589 type:complete len:83 (+) Transcript_104851:765-1013(+)
MIAALALEMNYLRLQSCLCTWTPPALKVFIPNPKIALNARLVDMPWFGAAPELNICATRARQVIQGRIGTVTSTFWTAAPSA